MRKETKYQLIDPILPDTSERERQVIADALLNEHALGDVIPLVHPDFFTTDARRQMWACVVDYFNRGKGTDLPTIGSTLLDLNAAEFQEHILPIYTRGEGAAATAPMEHACVLRDGAAARRAYLAATEFLQKSNSPGTTEQDLLEMAAALTRTIEGPAPLVSEKKLAAVIDEVKDEVRAVEKAKAEGKPIRITTGFRYIDYCLYGGLKPGQLVVLAARPSVGKTAVMLQMAKAAATAQQPVMVFSLEMTAVELGERMLYSTGKVRPFQLTHGDVPWDDFGQAEIQLAPLPVYINDFSRSLDEIVTRLTQAVKAGRCQVAFIDYLGLMSDAVALSGNVKLYQVIAKITGTLKAVAKRLGIPIVLLSQMNREQVREKRAPELYDLRDSGSIEQDADVVLMLEPKLEEGRILAHLRKNRSGKRDIAFVLIPNETYSAFDEAEPLDAGQPAPAPAAPAEDLPPYTFTPRPVPHVEDDEGDGLPF